MKEPKSEIIDNIASRGSGMSVPDGYFEDFSVKMASQLPFREELDVPIAQQKATKGNGWLRLRPYVYMAAMFAGAWCLLKMFALMSPGSNDINIERYPSLSLALQNDEQFIDEYIIDCVSQFDVVEESYLNALGVEMNEEFAYPAIDDIEFNEDNLPDFIFTENYAQYVEETQPAL